jgi:hypothetical protein
MLDADQMTPPSASAASKAITTIWRRPPPVDDPEIEALGEADRAALAERWGARAANELATSTAFAEIYRGLVALGAPLELLAGAARAVEDELRHAWICHHVATRYAQRDLDAPRVAPTAPPRFQGCNEREARVLHVVLHACLNEGFAVAYLGACLERATAPLAHAAVQELMRDEVEHARLGWAFLAGASPADRALVEQALPELVKHAKRLWLDDDGYPATLPKGHGCLGLDELGPLVAQALDELVLPGFEHVGVTTARARVGLGPA